MALIFEKALIISTLVIMMTWASQVTSHTLDDAEIAQKHEEWMTLHGRTYKDMAEKEMRFKIFKEAHKFIEKFNSEGNRTYKLGINKFADITNEEFLALYTGYKKMPTNSKPSPSASKTFRHENVDLNACPKSLDWRTRGAVTRVKNQGQCGVCWAFSAAATLEGFMKIKYGYVVSLSEEELKNCFNHGCSGNFVNNAFDYIIENGGLTTYNNYPYHPRPSNCQRRPSVRGSQIRGWEQIPYGDERALLKAVNMQPVSISVDSTVFQYYKGGIIDSYCGTDLNHAITLIGYGTSEDGINYWLIKNSWGEDWGERGYLRIKRDEGLCGIALEAFIPY